MTPHDPPAPDPPQSQPPAPAPDPERLRRLARLRLITDAVLVGVCAFVLARETGDALSHQVSHGMRAGAFLLNLTAAFVVVHRGFALVQRTLPAERTRRALGAAKWVLALVVPFIAAGWLERLTHQAHRANIDALAETVAARTTRAVAGGGTVSPADLEGLGGPYLKSLTVRRDTGEFLLEVSLPALDTDGYTGRYASTEARWRIHHNDEEAVATPTFDSTGPLLTCTREANSLRCN